MNRLLIILCIAIFLTGCRDLGATYNSISLKDPRMSDDADMHTVERSSLGLSPLPDIARQVMVELRPSGNPYDVMLHIYDVTSRTIAFKKSGDAYKWIHEQETTYGPNQYTDHDGTFTENIVITYETQRVSGFTPNRINVTYHGQRKEISAKDDALSLADVTPFLQKWRKLKK